MENEILERELEIILALLFSSIKTETYIEPFGIMAYLKAVYPNRWEKKMKEIYAQNDKGDKYIA